MIQSFESLMQYVNDYCASELILMHFKVQFNLRAAAEDEISSSFIFSPFIIYPMVLWPCFYVFVSTDKKNLRVQEFKHFRLSHTNNS